MLSATSARRLSDAAASVRRAYGLEHVYFAQIIGKRRHHLTGDGQEAFAETYHVELTPALALFWQGDLSQPDLAKVARDLAELGASVTAELQ